MRASDRSRMRASGRALPAGPAVAAMVAAVTVLLAAAPARAKAVGVNTPGGRDLYGPRERFGDALDQRRRRFVAEVAVGAGPEGNLGLLLGWLNVGLHGLELYGGIGFEAGPARHYTGAARLFGSFGGFRPYVGAGYLYRDLYAVDTFSHHAFAEIGHSWKLRYTNHLTLSAGLRRILHVGIRDDSPLYAADVDPDLLDAELGRVPRWVPMLALRYSRAF